ncbi:transcriptional regulator [Alkaliphilus sp. MSJ-5]|uniref:Transcriptional regulator n=1 Tax=Alkaliphilus flagellatus TaxID=2841507 RepID=A0ABS6G561_9FIRM|nr:transcriptional regulator [Alkaliphilus flagellatus]MBU5677630.1 transcriptional regulator [Alkaliphilus flagellatus]
MLTESQREILEAIHKYIQDNGISPTVRNICDLVGFKSSSTVHGYLGNLENQGFITKIDSSPRSISVTEKGLNIIKG